MRSESLPEQADRLDVNTASAVELRRLPGIGRRLALRIVSARQAQGPFESAADLLRVPGLTSKIVDRIAGHVHVGRAPGAPTSGLASRPSPSTAERRPEEASGPAASAELPELQTGGADHDGADERAPATWRSLGFAAPAPQAHDDGSPRSSTPVIRYRADSMDPAELLASDVSSARISDTFVAVLSRSAHGAPEARTLRNLPPQSAPRTTGLEPESGSEEHPVPPPASDDALIVPAWPATAAPPLRSPDPPEGRQRRARLRVLASALGLTLAAAGAGSLYAGRLAGTATRADLDARTGKLSAEIEDVRAAQRRANDRVDLLAEVAAQFPATVGRVEALQTNAEERKRDAAASQATIQKLNRNIAVLRESFRKSQLDSDRRMREMRLRVDGHPNETRGEAPEAGSRGRP